MEASRIDACLGVEPHVILSTSQHNEPLFMVPKCSYVLSGAENYTTPLEYRKPASRNEQRLAE
jgi:hypothetical protein